MRIIFLFLTMSAFAAETPVRVVLDLNDSSRLLGEMPAQSVSVDSATLGALKVALERVSVIRMERDGAHLFLRNGDKFQGKLGWTDVKLTTKLGELTVPLSHLRQLETLDPDGVPATLGDGLVLHLQFDRTNSAAKIHDAKPAAGHRGKPKSALEFDGKKSWVEIPNERRLARQVTMCAWVKQTGGGELTGLIVAALANRKPGAALGSSSGNGIGWSPSLEGGECPTDVVHPSDLDEWTLVVGTYDGVTAALYLNGRQVQTQRAPGVLAGRASVFAIGGAPGLSQTEPEPAPAPAAAPAPPADGAAAAEVAVAVPEPVDGSELTGWFKGLIDEVRIYDRALSADEVRALYEATK